MAEPEEEGNPFQMPSDDAIFMIREEERKKKQRERDERRKQKVHEKMTYSSKLSTVQRINDDVRMKLFLSVSIVMFIFFISFFFFFPCRIFLLIRM